MPDDSTPDDSALRTTVAVLTFRRPDEIKELLPLLIQQAEEVDHRADGAQLVDVLVVDNDPAGGAARVIAKFESHRLRYANEERPGIAAARNRALDESAESDLLVFIDDDERPVGHWLALLLEAQRKSRAVAVAGKVVSEFGGTLDPWIVAGGFFDRSHRSGLPSGALIDSAATNNLLLDLRQIRQLGLRFETKFGLSGGEDTLFTRQLSQYGGEIVWCAEAVVTDRVPTDRMTRRYVLKRSWSHGNSTTVIDLFISPEGFRRLIVRIRSCGRGLLRILGGAARSLIGTITRSTHHQARGLRTVMRGAGMVSGAFGHVYMEYARGDEPLLDHDS